MKILFIAPGASIHTTRWIERTVQMGFKVILVSQDGITPNVEYKTIIIPDSKYKNPFLLLIHNILNLKKIVYNESPDVIHLHWF